MSDTIYIDNNMGGDGPTAVFVRGAAVIYTGLEVQTERDAPLLAEISRLCGLDFFREAPAVPLYGVPYITVFASDGRGGWFICREDLKDGAIYHIAPDLSIQYVLDWFGALLEESVRNPDWRREHLPGGPWPRLPEDPAGREALAKALRLPHPAPEKSEKTAPPRIFSSRAAAEKIFPIQDLWHAVTG